MAHGARWCLVLAAAWLLGASLEARARTVPLVQLDSGLWTLPVASRHTARPWRFLIDTGSTRTLLSAAAARDAGITVDGGASVVTPSGRVAAGEVTLDDLRIGDRVLTGFPVLVLDLAALGRAGAVDGILGMDALAHDRVLLDLAGGQLSFVEAGDAASARGTAATMRQESGRVLLDARIDGMTRTLVLDSGAAHVVVYDARPVGAPVRLTTAGGGTVGRAGRANLSLGAVHLGAVPAVRMTAPAHRAGSDGLLPASLFASIYIDRAAGKVRLVPRR